MQLIYCIARLCMYCYSGVVPGKLSFMSLSQLPKKLYSNDDNSTDKHRNLLMSPLLQNNNIFS